MSAKIDKILQKDLLALMLKDKEFIYKAKRVIEPKFFTIKAYRFMFRSIINHYEKYEGELPSKKSILLQLNRKIKDDDIKKSFRKRIVPLFSRKVDSPKAISDEIYSWAEKQKFGLILEKAAEKSLDGKIDDAKDLIRSSFIFDSYDEDFDVHSFFETWKKRQKKRKRDRKNSKTKQIKTGLGVLDDYLFIRMNEPMFALLMGTSGVGKSIISMNVGVWGVKAGCNVAHFVFENTAKQTLDRYDTRFTKHPYHYLKNYQWTKQELSEANRIMRKMRQKRANHLKVIHAPIDTMNVPKIEALLKEIELKENWTPDLIIYDMLDDMLPSEKQESYRLGVKKTAKDIKKQTEYRNIPIICTTHAKAGAKGTRLKQEAFSESYDRPRSADVVLTISQSPEQEDDQQAEITLDKYRDGEGKVTILVDLLFRVMDIKYVEQVNISEEDENEKDTSSDNR